MDFSGSYEQGDVTFLLKIIDIQPTSVAEKERAIQSGARHYSEMVSEEKPPSPEYLRLFHLAVADNGAKFAAHVASLARTIRERKGDDVVVVSLARAGTPVGVLLQRALKHMGCRSTHYSVSIIRDRGIDWVALDYILNTAGHRDTDIVFVDGWTGKGVISNELSTSVAAYNAKHCTGISSDLYVVADLAGAAAVAVTDEDYLIPNAVLNATVSGLVGRTVLNPSYVGEGDFHGCRFHEELGEHDLSRYFVDTLTPYVLAELPKAPLATWTAERRRGLKLTSDECVSLLMERYGVEKRNNIKPGVGESTRALLRRGASRLILADPTATDVQHLVRLADEKGITTERDAALPYRAAVIISSSTGE